MRIFLDFDNDESYTPTKMQFLAGMGVHDLQEFCEMSFEQPRGWIDVDFSQVGPVKSSHRDGDGEGSDEDDEDVDWSARPLLKCFLVQVRILENHQNGKDTHLRGLQIFARDERAGQNRERMKGEPTDGMVDLARGSREKGEKLMKFPIPERPKSKKKRSDVPRIKKASWMLEPDMR